MYLLAANKHNNIFQHLKHIRQHNLEPFFDIDSVFLTQNMFHKITVHTEHNEGVINFITLPVK